MSSSAPSDVPPAQFTSQGYSDFLTFVASPYKKKSFKKQKSGGFPFVGMVFSPLTPQKLSTAREEEAKAAGLDGEWSVAGEEEEDGETRQLRINLEMVEKANILKKQLDEKTVSHEQISSELIQEREAHERTREELEFVKERFFFSMALALKLSVLDKEEKENASSGSKNRKESSSILSSELYDELLQENVPVQEWPQWLMKKMY